LGSLLEEAIERQQTFVESLHSGSAFSANDSGGQPALALTAQNAPPGDGLRLGVAGCAHGATLAAARAAALQLWQHLASAFPYDYHLEPALSQAELEAAAGRPLLRRAAPGGLVELRRPEAALHHAGSRLYLLERWSAGKFSNEQVWRALAGCRQPVLLHILLQPVVLEEVEELAIAQLAEAARLLAAQPGPASVQRRAAQAAAALAAWLESLHFPYLMQAHLCSPQPLPGYLPRLVGAAWSHDPAGRTAGFEAAAHPDPQQAAAGLAGLAPLLPAEAPYPGLHRARWLFGAAEAGAAFRLPFPPEPGLPGVAFEFSAPTIDSAPES
jgi:hypothetical protein